MISPIVPSAPGPPEARPKNAAEAASAFEALLIAQMLRSAREESDASADTMMDVAGQQFARMLANSGGLGLAKIITRSLK